MKQEDFTELSTGKLVPIISNSYGIKHAFIPEALPPDWDWPYELYDLLVEARSAISLLDGVGRYIKNPELLLSPLQAREAKMSSRLEGTHTETDQYLLFGVDPKGAAQESDSDSYIEVSNYANALKQSKVLREKLPISLRLMRVLHKELMTGVRGQNKAPGKFRKTQAMIGSPPRFIPPPPELLQQSLGPLEDYIQYGNSYDPLVKAFIVHYQFEAIHPFMDGNGRVGRLLLAIMIQEWCGLSNMWLYMSEYFDNNKDLYIKYLYNVSTTGNWFSWIKYCLEGVIEQANDTQARCDKLIKLNRSYQERINEIGGNIRLSRIIEDLFIFPATTVTSTANKLDIHYNTAKSDLDKLIESGIIIPLKSFSQKTFGSPEIIEIIFSDD